jgi:hypothetical protein
MTELNPGPADGAQPCPAPLVAGQDRVPASPEPT